MKTSFAFAIVVALVAAHPLSAGLAIEVEERLLKIDIQQCELASHDNLHVILRADIESAAVASDLPRGLLVTAEVSQTRRIRWQQLESMMTGEEVPPIVTAWETLQPRVKSQFFYVSKVATCGALLKRGTWIVSSVDDDGCDTVPMLGMCAFDFRRVIRSVPERSKRYLEPTPPR